MLNDFIAHKRVRLNGIVGIFPANAVNDDIEVRCGLATRGSECGGAHRLQS
jgi:cobalamin-dependent methionine synthase I